MFTYILVLILFSCLLELYLNCSAKARTMKKIPGPKNYFLVGNALAIMVSTVEIMKAGRVFAKTWKEGIYRFWMFAFAAVNIFHPDHVETIVSNVKYNEKSALYSILKPWLGDGLLLSKGTKWMQRRKILTPAFHYNILREFFKVMVDNNSQLVDKLHESTGEILDVTPIMSDLTLQTICETAMGTKLNDKTTRGGQQYKEALRQQIKVVYERGTKIPYFFDAIFYLSPLATQQAKHLKIIHSFTSKVIKDRMEYIEQHGINIGVDNAEVSDCITKKKPIAMLDLLISAAKDGLIENDSIQEEVDTFMFEGHDTTASGLTFCLMLLANHKDVQEKIFAELNEIFHGSKRSIEMEDLTKMKYLECCIKESLRLYPPIHFISRSLKDPVTLGNHEVPDGVFCHIHIYDLHRREDLFPKPNDYIPERFLLENSIGRHPFAFIPFSAGPRNCIGQKFAMMEMKSVVAAVLREFELVPVTRPSDIEYVADLVLRNNGPVEVIFNKRT